MYQTAPGRLLASTLVAISGDGMAQLLATRTRPAGVPGPGRWIVDPARTRVNCSGRASRLLPTVQAWFAATAGEIRIGDDPNDSGLDVSIDVAHLTTGNGAWDQALRAADPLSATRYPVATYRSRSIRWTAPGQAEIDGDLELSGGSQRVSLSVSYRDGEDEVELSATGSIMNQSPVSIPGLSYLVPRRFALDIQAVAILA
jgi:polyisoprenoid-binding protein YceI